MIFKVFSIITVILIIAGCSHEHELLPHDHNHEHAHDHELLPHDHESFDKPVGIVSISDSPYTPDIPPNYDASGFCSGKVEIVFSSVLHKARPPNKPATLGTILTFAGRLNVIF